MRTKKIRQRLVRRMYWYQLPRRTTTSIATSASTSRSTPAFLLSPSASLQPAAHQTSCTDGGVCDFFIARMCRFRSALIFRLDAQVRASSMLACEDMECCRRFCEHCLLTHLNEDIDRATSNSWSLTNGKEMWLCPICRKRCCCSVSFCEVAPRPRCGSCYQARERLPLPVTAMTDSLRQ
jgi:hypothetical protein